MNYVVVDSESISQFETIVHGYISTGFKVGWPIFSILTGVTVLVIVIAIILRR